MYVQAVDWPSARSSYEAAARLLGQVDVLRIRGMVGSPGTFTYGELVDLATLRWRGDFSVPLVDLMSTVQLDADADLLVVGGRDGGSILLPLRHAFDRSTGSIVLGTSSGPLSFADGFPARLDVAEPPEGPQTWSIRSISATTFAAFVR